MVRGLLSAITPTKGGSLEPDAGDWMGCDLGRYQQWDQWTVLCFPELERSWLAQVQTRQSYKMDHSVPPLSTRGVGSLSREISLDGSLGRRDAMWCH